MANKILNLDQLRLAKTEKNNIVIVFAYNFENANAICGVMKDNNFKIAETPINKLRICSLYDLNEKITHEDEDGNLKMGLGYLMQVGISETYWDNKWGTFDWKTVDCDSGQVNIVKPYPPSEVQTQSRIQ